MWIEKHTRIVKMWTNDRLCDIYKALRMGPNMNKAMFVLVEGPYWT